MDSELINYLMSPTLDELECQELNAWIDDQRKDLDWIEDLAQAG